MPADVIRTLEFDHVRDNLERHCAFSLSAERARELGPSSDADTVRYLLDVTRQAVDVLEARPGFGVGGARDIRAHLQRANIGATLSPSDLLEVLDTISAARVLRRAFAQLEDRHERFPAFSEFMEFVAELPNLEADLRRSIGDDGEVLDGASDELKRIRQQLRSAQSRAAERIRRYTRNSQYTSALQEPIVTTRDGRYVVPVRADRRSQLPGIVHDRSASGQTLFVEPSEMVDLNNRCRELEAEEEHEIERILAALTTSVAGAEERLSATLEALAAIDLALAKARYAWSARLMKPTIVDETSTFGRRIALKKARHPLLDPATVVPIDLVLGDQFRVLVVTGPNTGGKTVALKTVGSLALMAQSGLYIPADDGSELCVFDGVFADIGDEQSIEQSLSTFSSHMTRVIAALRSMSDRSLVLFDELGAGTDPEEGSALARSIIHQLLESGCLAIATTHYSDLKTFAYSTPGVENASVEFDVETLSPTFKLLTGVPGRSNALAIAERLGMPSPILEQSRELLGPNVEHADELIAEIQTRRAAAEQAQQEAEDARRKASEELAEAEERRASAENQALAEIEQELADVRERLRRIRKLPERMQPEEYKPAVESAQQDLQQARSEVKQAAHRRSAERPAAQTLAVGDRVELLNIGGEGEVVGIVNGGGEVDVLMGSFKIRQPVRSVRKLESQPSSQRQADRSQRVSTPAPRRRVDNELHLRGQRVSGVDEILDDYLDDAYLSHLPFVRIVHGKGTGALRDAVREFLSGHPLVQRFENPPENEGGDGVTIAYLRES